MALAIPELGVALHSGRDDIDGQHRLMFEAARKVLAVDSARPDLLIKAVRFLQAYVHYHFRAEEHVMVATDYDRREHHMRQHALIRKEVEEIRAALVAGGAVGPLIARVQVLFQDWYVFHIREVDVPLAVHLRAHSEATAQAIGLPTSSELVATGRLAPEYDGIELPGYPGDLPR